MRILLIVYDNGAYVHHFPIGTAYIASSLEKAGFEVAIYSQDVNHYSEAHLLAHLNECRYDMVGLGFVAGYYPYAKAQKIAQAVNASRNRPFFVLGGHGPSPEPEFFLKLLEADAVVIGEGDETMTALARALDGRLPLSSVAGVAFREDGQVTVNPARPLVQDIDSLPPPATHLFDMTHYRLYRAPGCEPDELAMPIISGRGCPFHCTFCYRMMEGFRPRSVESILQEVEGLKSRYNVSYVMFNDELMMSSRERMESICDGFIKSGIGVKWGCNGRLNYAAPDLLRRMGEAGCVFVSYGIESMDDAVLRKMKKGLTTSQIRRGIEATIAAGVTPGLNMLFGNVGDTRETLRKNVEFLLEYDDGSQCRTIRPVTPYPGSPLYYHAIEQGKLEGPADFYAKHINSEFLTVNFTSLGDDEFHECLLEANTALLTNYYDAKKKRVIDATVDLYRNKNTAFRGYRHS